MFVFGRKGPVASLLSTSPAVPVVTIAIAAAWFAAALPSTPLAAPPAETAASGEKGPEVGGAATAFLGFVTKAGEEALRSAPGLTRPVVDKLLAHRKSGGTFKNLVEFRRITGISPQDMELALSPYAQIDENLAIEQGRRPVVPAQPAGKPAAKAAGRVKTAEAAAPGKETAAGGTPPPAAPQGDGPIGHVRPGWYAKLPGYDDLDRLEPAMKTEFLERVNNERCQCGCQNETLAFCLVNDPGCPVVKGRVRKIYEDITRKPSP